MKDKRTSQPAEPSEKNQWDAGMRASMEVCLADYWGSLRFICGYEINKRPNEADLVIVKKTDSGRLDDIVAEFFDYMNVIEFKCPGDHLGISELYKARGYASMVVSNGFENSSVNPRNVTITLVREERPNAIISHLKSDNMRYSNPYPGIYRFTGDGHFPLQILAYGEMDDARWLVMRSMTRKMTREMSGAVKDVLEPFRAAGRKEELLVETIIHTYFKANIALFKEGDPMYEWIEPIYKPKMERIAVENRTLGRAEGKAEGMAEGRAEGEARGIISTMQDLGYGASDIIKRLMLKLGCDSDAAARMIAECVN